MNYQVRISANAEAEIDANVDWWSQNRSAEQAYRWYVDVFDAIYALAVQPTRCGRARENKSFSYELRSRQFGLGSHPSHRILSTIMDDVVVVLSVRNVAQADVSEQGLPTPGDV